MVKMTTDMKENTKKEIIEYAQQLGIPINPKDKKEVIRQQAIDYIWNEISKI